LKKLLALDPRERITAKEALRHDFFKPVSKIPDLLQEYTNKLLGYK
jgi:serine/threonine protein kinase